jgi:hypothetical protein
MRKVDMVDALRWARNKWKARAEAAERHLCNSTPATYWKIRNEVSEHSLATANDLLVRIIKYAREDGAITPGSTRLARALDDVDSFLANQSTEKEGTPQ